MHGQTHLHCVFSFNTGVSDKTVGMHTPNSQTLWTVVYCLAGTSHLLVGLYMRMNDIWSIRKLDERVRRPIYTVFPSAVHKEILVELKTQDSVSEITIDVLRD